MINDIICGVPQGSTLWSLLFLIFINNLQQVSKTLELIKSADNTNYFTHTKIQILFFYRKCRTGKKLNNGLKQINSDSMLRKLSSFYFTDIFLTITYH